MMGWLGIIGSDDDDDDDDDDDCVRWLDVGFGIVVVWDFS